MAAAVGAKRAVRSPSHRPPARPHPTTPQGFGWAIAKQLAEAGAEISLGVWVPALNIFETSYRRGKFDASRALSNGGMLEFAHIYPMDAVFDTLEDVPEDVRRGWGGGQKRGWAMGGRRGAGAGPASGVCPAPPPPRPPTHPPRARPQILTNKRYAGNEGWTVSGVADKVAQDIGKVDIVVHSLANGPEVQVRRCTPPASGALAPPPRHTHTHTRARELVVTWALPAPPLPQKPLLETSRRGYLAAMSASSYSFVSMMQRFGPLMNPGGAAISLTYIAADRVIPGTPPRCRWALPRQVCHVADHPFARARAGYGGGMSSAKAALESDTRVLAYEVRARRARRPQLCSMHLLVASECLAPPDCPSTVRPAASTACA